MGDIKNPTCSAYKEEEFDPREVGQCNFSSSGVGNYFQHLKKILNLIFLANVKVDPAKFFNFGFYCNPSLF